MAPRKTIFSYLAAAALAIVTIFTFYVFQDFGPHSVIRRFHMDVERGNWSDLNRITTHTLDRDVYTQRMATIVQQLVRANASYEIVDLKRSHRQVIATAVYHLRLDTTVILWHVTQEASDWRIDCDSTYTATFASPMF